MKVRIHHILMATASALLLYACAKQSSPMGGPKDETPPTLISSNPKDQTLNTKPENITLIFDEFIKTDNPNRNIIITPSLQKDKIEFLALKNELRIKLHQELEDSTTYVFNFQKSIQDISEGNAAENLKLVFSTGSMIDSLQFSGKVTQLFPPKNPTMEDIIVGLYRIQDDTMDVFTDPPYYLTQTDSSGNFVITNIKAGDYRAYAWHDANNSTKAEFKSEAYSFINDTIRMDQNVQNAHFILSKANLSDFKVTRSTSVGTNFDVVLSKIPSEIKVENEAINEKLFYRLDEKNIRFYHTEMRNDSTPIHLMLSDSVGFRIDTTLYARFEESDRKLEKLEGTFGKEKEFSKTIQTSITFNKPLARIQYDSLYVQYDTASFIPLSPQNLQLKDSIRRTELLITLPVADSISVSNFQFLAADSTFFDIENQPNEKPLKTTFSRINEDNLADELTGQIMTDEYPIIVQLLTKEGELVRQTTLKDQQNYSFKKIKAGEYMLRAIIDRNKNGKWDPSNYFERRQAEPIYYYYDTENKSYFILLRGKWTNQNVNIIPGHRTGLPDKTTNPLPADSLSTGIEPLDPM